MQRGVGPEATGRAARDAAYSRHHLLHARGRGRAVEGEPAQAVIHRYIIATAKYADAAAMLAPALPGLIGAEEVAPRLDGLLMTGSPSNIEPYRYGQPDAGDDAGPFDPARDEMSQALPRAMLAQGKPVFGICRGLQELNLLFGGTLRRDCAENPELLVHHTPKEVAIPGMFALTHPVSLSPGGRLARAYGRENLSVSSVHFQGIDRLGAGLSIEATAPDGVIEAVSGLIDGAPALGVQWHPEWQAEHNLDGQIYFELLGRAVRGDWATS